MMADRSMRTRVFLSHSSQDLSWVEAIRAQAVAMGVEVYLFNQDLHPGDNTAEKLQRAIEESHAVIVLLTSNSALSPYVNQEIGYAKAHGIPIIPLVEHNLPQTRLGMLQGVDYIPFNPEHVQPSLTELTRVLHEMEQERAARSMTEPRVAVELTQSQVVLAVAVVALLLFLAYSAGGSAGRS